MHKGLAVGARHCWINLSDSRACDAQDCRRKIHRHAESDKPPSVRRRNLKQRYVDRQPSGLQQPRHLLQRDGHVVELAGSSQTAHFGADEKGPMAVVSARSTFNLRQSGGREKADELEVQWSRPHRLERGKQSVGSRATRAEIDATASPDLRHCPFCRKKLQADIKWF
jgi:hypothetical protein